MSSIGTSQNIVPQYSIGHNGQSGGAGDELYAIYMLVVSIPGCRVSTPCFYVQPLASDLATVRVMSVNEWVIYFQQQQNVSALASIVIYLLYQ